MVCWKKLLAASLFLPSLAESAICPVGSWNIANSGNYSDPTKWSLGCAPDGLFTATVTFATVGSGTSPVFVNMDVLGLNDTIIFNASNDYTISGTGLLDAVSPYNFSGPGSLTFSLPQCLTDVVSITQTGSSLTNLNVTESSSGFFGALFSSIFTPFTLSNGTFSNINTGQISNDSAGAVTFCSSFSMADGSLSVINSGMVNSIYVGSKFFSYSMVIDGGVVKVNNAGDILNGFGAQLETADLIMNGGTLTITNTGFVASGDTAIGSLVTSPTITLNGGLFENNDRVQTNALFIGAAATFSGSGRTGDPTYFAAVTNDGTVIPGEPKIGGTPGVMNIEGTYAQGSSGALVINIKDPTHFSQLLVSGLAMIDGSLGVVLVPGFSPSGGSLKIIQATEGITGMFANLMNFTLPFDPTISYFPNYVLLEFPAFLTKYPNLAGTIISSVNQFNQMERLNRFVCKESYQECFDCPDEDPRDQVACPWNFYVGPIGTFSGESHSKHDQVGYDYWTAGALIGFDYVWSHYGVGFAFEYERIDADVHQHWGEFDINHYHGSLYGKYAISCMPALAFNAIMGGSYETYKIDRKISSLKAKGSPNGAEFDALLGAEYVVNKYQFQFIPVASVQYIWAQVDKYREHHAGTANLKYRRQTLDSLRSTLGLKINTSWEGCNVAFVPEINVDWQYEYLYNKRHLHFATAELDSATASLILPRAGRNSLLAGINLLTTWSGGYCLEARYDFEWNKLYQDHFVSLSFNTRF